MMLPASIDWSDPARQHAFGAWLAAIAGSHRLQAGSVRLASADASFRRYFRVEGLDAQTSFIIMDAPPAQENCAPFVHVAELMRGAGVQAPRVLAWDEPLGFMLLSDLGARTMMDAIGPPTPGPSPRPSPATPRAASASWPAGTRRGTPCTPPGTPPSPPGQP